MFISLVSLSYKKNYDVFLDHVRIHSVQQMTFITFESK